MKYDIVLCEVTSRRMLSKEVVTKMMDALDSDEFYAYSFSPLSVHDRGINGFITKTAMSEFGNDDDYSYLDFCDDLENILKNYDGEPIRSGKTILKTAEDWIKEA